MNSRKKGRRFEKLEEKVWAAAGWETELVRPETRFIGPGKAVVAYRDFFGRYDLIVVSPRIGTTIFVQVSTESPTSSHKSPGPMGLHPPFWFGSLEEPSVDEMMERPSPGTFEAFVQYKKEGRSYQPYRTWWTRTFK